VSGPQLDNDIKFVDSRAQVSGPTMLNIRGKAEKELRKEDGKQRPSPKVSIAPGGLSVSKSSGDSLYHIHDVSDGESNRITLRPMKLGDIHARYGKDIEKKGFRLIPHKPAKVRAAPQEPKKK